MLCNQAVLLSYDRTTIKQTDNLLKFTCFIFMFCFDSFSSCFPTLFSFGFLFCLRLFLWLIMICTGLFMFALDIYSCFSSVLCRFSFVDYVGLWLFYVSPLISRELWTYVFVGCFCPASSLCVLQGNRDNEMLSSTKTM